MRPWRACAWAYFGVAVAACGYRPMYASPGTAQLSVAGSSVQVVDVAVVAELESGLRTGLARAGALRASGQYPRVVVEVLRIDRASSGVVAVPGGRSATRVGGLPLVAPGAAAPLARATRVGVVARAWIEREPGGARERETGDVRASDSVAVEPVAGAEALRDDDALRASARRLGERLARIVLGYPDASDEAM